MLHRVTTWLSHQTPKLVCRNHLQRYIKEDIQVLWNAWRAIISSSVASSPPQTEYIFLITLLFLCRWKTFPKSQVFQTLTIGCCSSISPLFSVAQFGPLLLVNSRPQWNRKVPQSVMSTGTNKKRRWQNMHLGLGWKIRPPNF